MEKNTVLSFFPPEVTEPLYAKNLRTDTLREVRIRAGSPLVARTDILHVFEHTFLSHETVRRTAERMCQNSIYAKQEELKNGYITLPGGHRAGFCGRAITENGQIRCLCDISSINLRIAHEIFGAADAVLPLIVQGGDVCNTLIVSPPACGKTTLLRDLARQLGGATYRFRVGIADERDEIAAVYRGVPQNDVGFLTDVYASVPKAAGMQMLLRGMSPQVIITDELGDRNDAQAVYDLAYAGVRVICSLHGTGREDACARPFIGDLLSAGIFRRVITLSSERGVGTIVSVS